MTKIVKSGPGIGFLDNRFVNVTGDSMTGALVVTSGAAANFVPLTINQNDTTNNPNGFFISQTSSGTPIRIEKNSSNSIAMSLKGLHAGGRMTIQWIDENGNALANMAAHTADDPASDGTHWQIYTPNASATMVSRFAIDSKTDDPTIHVDAPMRVAIPPFTTSQAKIELTSDADNTILLKFGMDRIWQFEQDGTGSSTALVLRTTSATKNFDLQDDLSATFVRFASAGHILNTGYLRVGSITAPTNTTAGDLTFVRGFATSLALTGAITGATGYNGLVITADTGAITTGTWSATTIAVDKGGTGQTSYTNGQLLIGNTTGNTLTKATLTGTADRLTVTNGGGSITLDVAATYVGQNTITTLGTITTGTWNGTDIAVADGGTGASTAADARTNLGLVAGGAGDIWVEKAGDTMSGDLLIYDAVNDGNPQFRIGAADAEELHIQSVYDSGAQTLNYVIFQTDVASATADRGLFRFNVDGTDILDIDDGGINFAASKGISIAGTDILTDAAGTATLSNIDAIDDTTESTIEAAIDTLANLTAAASLATVGTITTGTWNATDVALAAGGTGASLTDPNADRIFFWDDSDGATTWLAPGNSIAITTTTLDTIQDIRTSASPSFTGLTLSGNQTTAGYLRVGSNVAPTNTTAGDLTAVRLKVVDGAFGTGVDFSVTGDGALSGFLRVGSETAPANTTAGDLTGIRLSIGNSSLGTDNIVVVTGTSTSTSGTRFWANFTQTIAPASNSTAEFRSLQFQNVISPGTGITLGTIRGGYYENRVRSDSTVSNLVGLQALGFVTDSSSAATAVATNTFGMIASAYSNASGTTASTITTAIAYDTTNWIGNGSATITTAKAVNILNGGTGHTITTLIGLDVAALTRGATNIGVRIALPSGGATANYALQLSDTTGVAAGGITFGTDVTLYRSAANVLKTDDSLTVVGRVLKAQGADVGSANDLTLGSDGNTFEITGTTQVNAITIASWQNGSMVTLLFTSTPTVKHNTAGGAGTAVILLAGAADFVASAGDTLTLVLSEIGGTQAWREVARAVI